MGNEQKLIELQRDTVLTGYKPLILHDDETGTICTDCTVTPMMLLAQEQQNIQRLLSAGTPAPRKGFRDKIRQWWEGIQQTTEG